MFNNILLPTDGSGAALIASQAVAVMVKERPATKVTIAVVINPLTADETGIGEEALARQNAYMRQQAEKALELAAASFADHRDNLITKILTGDPVSGVIAKEATEGGYDLIALGSRGMGMLRSDLHYLGSVTEHVIRRVGIPVLVIPIQK
ncbi:MAG TPA: universal stress protein [Capsulimonadaceae bacterium]